MENLIERCAGLVWRRVNDDGVIVVGVGSRVPEGIVRDVIAEFVAWLRHPATLDRLAERLDWADDERVRAAGRDDAVRVIEAIAEEVAGCGAG